MRKLPIPTQCAWQLARFAAAKFASSPLEAKILNAQRQIEQAYSAFSEASNTASWYSLESCNWGQPMQVILADITKGELKNLYTSGVVGGIQEARDIYDELIVSADGKCPYCGGIGHVGTLDHYLPKSRYPAYSVLPINLIPCCEKCNKLSGSPVFSTADHQTINPYFDDIRYFSDAWVGVRFDDGDILSYQYEFRPPDQWPDLLKFRALRHFTDYQLSVRYGTAASGEIGYLNDLPRSMGSICNKDAIRVLLMTKADSESFDLNGWQRPLYKAAAEAEWFLDQFQK